MAVAEDVIVRIQKLLAVSEDRAASEHEAESFAAKAQALMQQYDLEIAEVKGYDRRRDDGAAINQAGHVKLRQEGKPGAWRQPLFKAVGETSGCWVYTGSTYEEDARGRHVRFETAYLIGAKRDNEMAQYLFSFLVHELDRLQQEYGRKRWDELWAYAAEYGISKHDAEARARRRGDHPLRAKQSWVEGAAEAVASKLRSDYYERNKVSGATSALVVDKEAAIRDWWAMKHYGKTWAEHQEDMKKRTQLHQSETQERRPPTKREIERDERANERYWNQQQRAEDRKWANRDLRAYREGADVGRGMSIRPGVNDGGEKAKELGG